MSLHRVLLPFSVSLLLGLVSPSPVIIPQRLAGDRVPATPPGSADLSRYLRLAADQPEKSRVVAELRRGLELSRAGDAPAAIGIFQRVVATAPGLQDWTYIFAAQAAARAGDTAGVRQHLEATEPDLAREWGWRARTIGHRNAGDLAGAVQTAENGAGTVESASRRAEAWKYAGEIRLLMGDTVAASAAFRRAMDAAPLSPAAVEAARLLGALPGIPPEDRLQIGRLYLRHRNYDRGIAGLEAYLASGRGTRPERDAIRLELGRALFEARRYATAEGRLLGLRRDGTAPDIAAQALLLAGRAQYRQGKEAEARATLARVVERFPREPSAIEALYILADLDHDAGDLIRARERFQRVLQAATGTEKAAVAAMRLGGMAFVAGDYEAAARVFEMTRAQFLSTRYRQQAAYWAGRAYAALGNESLARERFAEARDADPVSYYGMRAAERLGDSAWQIPLAPAPSTGEDAATEVRGAIFRLDVLRELDLSEASQFEMDRLKRHFADRRDALYALAEAFNARGETYTGIRLGRELYQAEGAWNPRLLRIVYPFPYSDLIKREAARYGLDPFLIAGLIRQESMFNPQAVSAAGAIGLMQLMPSTGRTLARAMGGKSLRTADLKQPELNIRLGTRHVANLLRAYDGNWTEMLAAYNAGASRLERWRQFPEYQDPELFVERIPFQETREYVKIVQQNARWYAALYGEGTLGRR